MDTGKKKNFNLYTIYFRLFSETYLDVTMGSSHHLLVFLMFLHYAVGKPCHLLYYLPVNGYIVVVLLWYSVQCFITQVSLITVWRSFQTPAVALLLRWEKTSPQHVTSWKGALTPQMTLNGVWGTSALQSSLTTE